MKARPVALWLAVAVALAAGGPTEGANHAFSHRPSFIDPRLGGWVAPLQTVGFELGCGELLYVSAIYLGDRSELNVLCRSKVTLRGEQVATLQRFAQKVARGLKPTVDDLARRGAVLGLVVTFYTVVREHDGLTLRVYDACLPARGFTVPEPFPLRLVESRATELPAP